MLVMHDDFGSVVVVQLTAVESALTSLQAAITASPDLYGLPKQMQQLSKVHC